MMILIRRTVLRDWKTFALKPCESEYCRATCRFPFKSVTLKASRKRATQNDLSATRTLLRVAVDARIFSRAAGLS